MDMTYVAHESDCWAEFHSEYKYHNIVKIYQPNGRITYDVYDSRDNRVALGISTLVLARAEITAIVDA